MNGVIADVITPVDVNNDIVQIDGDSIRQEDRVYIMLNKPPGYLCSCNPDRELGKSVLELVNIDVRVYPVGRLDRESRGMLILTNDGEMTYKLTHPSFEKEKEYIVRLKNPLTFKQVQLLRDGISLNILKGHNQEESIAIVGDNDSRTGREVETIWKDVRCSFYDIQAISGSVYRIVLKQGIKRQIRIMSEYIGNEVLDLKRVRIGGLCLQDLKEGKWRYLSEGEIQKLLS